MEVKSVEGRNFVFLCMLSNGTRADGGGDTYVLTAAMGCGEMGVSAVEAGFFF